MEKQMVSPRLTRPLRQVLEVLPPSVRGLFDCLQAAEDPIEEIRINQDKPLMVRTKRGDAFVTQAGLSRSSHGAARADHKMISDLLDALTRSSVYALEDMMREGYLPLPGGHRVGLAGESKTEGGRVIGFKHVTGFNIRINRPVPGAALPVLRHLRKAGGIWSTLIVSPPGCGKTTLLRDIVRLLSYGEPSAGFVPLRVGVADERSEIGGSYHGVPQNDLGPRTDVIDGCPKRFALTMLVRTMSPDVVATDEIGHPDDASAVIDAVGAGVTLLCTAHGSSVSDLEARPSVRPLLEGRYFGRILILSRRHGPGTVERVIRRDVP